MYQKRMNALFVSVMDQLHIFPPELKTLVLQPHDRYRMRLHSVLQLCFHYRHLQQAHLRTTSQASAHHCHWILNFLLERPQEVRPGPHLSSTITLYWAPSSTSSHTLHSPLTPLLNLQMTPAVIDPKQRRIGLQSRAAEPGELVFGEQLVPQCYKD